MKKLLSLMTVFVFGLLFLTACADEETGPASEAPDNDQEVVATPADNGATDAADGALPPLTSEEITLSIASWEHPLMMYALADSFMEAHPNITVEVRHVYIGEFNSSLFNMAAAGDLPDVFWYLGDITAPLNNGWMLDFADMFYADPETAYLPASLQVAGNVAGRRVSAPSKVLPFAFFLDRAVFERANVPMPPLDWTWSDMIETAERMTIPGEEPIFGIETFTLLRTTGPIVNQDAVGEFGWNGYEFDFSGFADAYDQEIQWRRMGVFPPAVGPERESALGTYNVWPASTGQLAMQKDAIWTANYFATPAFVDNGIDWVIYPMPRGDYALTDNKPAFIDFGAISSVTEHPREAYELLKWFGWGIDGFAARMDAWETIEYEDGRRVFTTPDAIPVLTHEPTWDRFVTMFPDTDHWNSFLDSVRSPVPMGASNIPGFEAFLNWMGEQEIWYQIDTEQVRVHDIINYIEENANRFVREGLERAKLYNGWD